MIYNESDLLERIGKFLFESQQRGVETLLILTGGKTIINFYSDSSWRELLSKFDNITFADERIVSTSSVYSNSGNFLRYFPSLESRVIMPVTHDGKINGQYEKRLSFYLSRDKCNSICLSGFGLDGHIWSLFKYSDLLNDDFCLLTSSEIHDFQRITLGRKAMENIDVNLLFSSQEKWNSLTGKYSRAPLIHLLQDIYIV